MAVCGDEIHMGVSGFTGQMADSPFKGSRMMELTKEDAAWLGFPGLTVMVGSRATRPSTNPFRL
jgi:hypothetical protein